MQHPEFDPWTVDVREHAGPVDPIALLSNIPAHQAAMFWRHADTWWVAQGSAWAHTPDTHDWEGARSACARMARALAPEARAHARLVGGFSFDPNAAQDTWRGFGPMTLWAPAQCVHHTPHATHVTCVGTDATPCTEVEPWLSAPRAARSACGEVPAAKSPGAAQWGALVDRTARLLAQDAQWHKVVLARPLVVRALEPWSVDDVVERLCQTYPTCRVFALRPPGATAWFVGATPECLVRAQARLAYVDALAGTAAPEVDDEVFLSSKKDRREHQLVIDAIEEGLKGLGTVHVPERPSVDRLPNVSHLRTPIRATLERGDLLDAAERLHPTPAVCGLPRERARGFIRECEGLERGWYTGGIGWVDALGDGEWDVALRCALLEGAQATIYAGAGIVSASTGEAELEETRLKAQAMLNALGVAQGAL